MKIPCSYLLPSGKVLFAAKGGKLHSFNLDTGSHLSTWRHPNVDKLAQTLAATGISEPNAQSVQDASAASEPAEEATGDNQEDDSPPAKRQKLEKQPGGEEASKVCDAMETDEPPNYSSKQKHNGFKNGKQRQSEKKDRKGGPQPKGNLDKAPDQPLISHILATTDSSHVVALTGNDKSIWVFEHDGSGSLKLLSQRAMPKRPCAALISPDNTMILSADKFGDVYTLPLIPSPPPTDDPASASSPAPSRSTPTPGPPSSAPKQPWKPEATNLTVHSRRNLDALHQQQLQAERNKKKAASQDQGQDKSTFEYTLIIGHVSLLTSMILAQRGERRYILTADRDEHVRVSRYVPQAYVIEGFCMGHRSFVNAMIVPERRPEVLVSGGGDDELFVWDWLAGNLLSKFDLLGLAKCVVEGLAKVAVTHLSTAVIPESEGGGEGGRTSLVFALCEGIPAVFVTSLSPSATALTAFETIPFSGNPLHLANVLDEQNGTLKRLLVTTDAGSSATGTAGVWALDYDGSNRSFKHNASYTVQDAGLGDDEPNLSGEEVRKLLCTAEDLRKVQFDAREVAEEAGEQGTSEAGGA